MNATSGITSQGQMPMQRPPNVALSDEQKTSAQDIVAKYDPESMTADSRMAMRQELKAAGIGPGEDLKGIMEEAGFDAPQVRGSKGPPGPPPGKSEEVESFIEKYESGDYSMEDIDNLIQSLKTHGEQAQGLLLDEQV